MSPHYNRYAGISEQTLERREPRARGDDAMDDAAEAIRQAELEAVQKDANRGAIIDRGQLLTEIRKRL